MQAMEKYNIEKDIAAFVKKAREITGVAWKLTTPPFVFFKLMMRLFFCRSLTKSTTPHGIASWGGTLAATWPTRQNTSFISTWAKWPFCSSSRAEMQTRRPGTSFIQPIPFFAATSKETCAAYSCTAIFSVIHGLKISTLLWILCFALIYLVCFCK